MIPSSQQSINERFELWFQQEMPRLYRYLCYQTHDQSTAEEITAITCTKALSRLNQYDPQRGELRVWLFGIARNELRAFYRSLKQQPAQISINCLPEFVFQSPSTEQVYQRKETFLQVLQVLGSYPEREQEVIALRYGAALPVHEIAEIMDLSDDNVSVLIHRTIDKLKKSQKEVCYAGK